MALGLGLSLTHHLKPPGVSAFSSNLFLNQDRFGVMASPPTITFGTATSSVNNNYSNGTVSHSVTGTILQSLGSIFVAGTLPGPRDYLAPSHITLSTDAKTTSGPIRVRFETDAPAFDLCFLDTNQGFLNLLVDGEYVSRSKIVTFTNTGNYRYLKVDFGTNTTTFSKAQTTFTVSAGGSGHATGDVVTLNGGSGGAAGTACTVKVTSVSSGVVLSVDIVNPGAYTTQPTGTFSQTATTGAGTGLQLGASFFARNHTTRRMRRIEVIYHGISFLGAVVTTSDHVINYTASTNVPKLVVIGDSIMAGTYLAYGGAHIGATIAQKLGMWDNLVISAQGGTGWNTTSGTSLKWSDSRRIADFSAHQADVYLFIGGQNDTSGSSLESAVTSVLSSLRSSLPQAVMIGIGPVIGNSSAIATSIANGFANTAHPLTAFLNNVSPVEWIPTTMSTNWTVTSDANHLGQEGQDYFAEICAEQVAETLRSMV